MEHLGFCLPVLCYRFRYLIGIWLSILLQFNQFFSEFRSSTSKRAHTSATPQRARRRIVPLVVLPCCHHRLYRWFPYATRITGDLGKPWTLSHHFASVRWCTQSSWRNGRTGFQYIVRVACVKYAIGKLFNALTMDQCVRKLEIFGYGVLSSVDNAANMLLFISTQQKRKTMLFIIDAGYWECVAYLGNKVQTSKAQDIYSWSVCEKLDAQSTFHAWNVHHLTEHVLPRDKYEPKFIPSEFAFCHLHSMRSPHFPINQSFRSTFTCTILALFCWPFASAS